MASLSAFQIYYFVAVWLVAALAGVSRCVHNGDYQSFVHCVAVAAMSGFLGFSIIAIIAGNPSQPNFNHMLYLGLSALCGLSGKNQTEFITAARQAVIRAFLSGTTENKT